MQERNKALMKTYSRLTFTWTGILGACLAMLGSANSLAIPPRQAVQASAEDKENAAAPAEASAQVIIDRNESRAEEEPTAKTTAWLGISTAEASEALTAQLDLKPGVGLVVTYVVGESPAAKAGLLKNDVLVSFDDQSLVHPAQLRK